MAGKENSVPFQGDPVLGNREKICGENNDVVNLLFSAVFSDSNWGLIKKARRDSPASL